MRLGLFDYYGQLGFTANTWTCNVGSGSAAGAVTSVASSTAIMENGTTVFDHLVVSGAESPACIHHCCQATTAHGSALSKRCWSSPKGDLPVSSEHIPCGPCIAGRVRSPDHQLPISCSGPDYSLGGGGAAAKVLP